MNLKSTKVSIIIPIYKVEQEIERCLKSVTNQDYDNLDIILVDDASPDSSIDIARKFIENSNKSELFRIVTHDHNQGLSAARNTGIINAEGDYLYFLDSDDELYDNLSISKFVDNLIKTKADIIYGNYIRIFPSITVPSIYTASKVLSCDQLIQEYTKGHIPIMAWNQLISKDFLIQNNLNFKNGILNEDNLFSYISLFKNPKVSLLGEVTYKNYVREGSIMNSFNLNRLISPVIVYEEATKAYREINGDDPRLLINLDHFAFKRCTEILNSAAEPHQKKDLYKRLKTAQRKMKGVGKMRYLFNSHIYLPTIIGYPLMRFVAKYYAKSRNL